VILVFGASGKTGSATVEALLARKAAFRAVYRDPASRAAARRRGIDAVSADYRDAASLDAALAGVERIFLVAPPVPVLAELEQAAVEAAVRAGARQVVKVSAWDVPGGRYQFTLPHQVVEALIVRSGLQWTFLRPNGFMQQLLASAPMIRDTGTWVFPLSGGVSLIDTRDVGRVAAEILTGSEHEGQAYELSGPEALTQDRQMAILSEALGREIRFVAPPDEEWRAGALAAGLPEWLADRLIDLQRYFRNGEASRITGEVERLTGSPPTSFRRFAQDYASAFR
jgi:uncharacterized protein YbjT (DUF2867 family)